MSNPIKTYKIIIYHFTPADWEVKTLKIQLKRNLCKFKYSVLVEITKQYRLS